MIARRANDPHYWAARALQARSIADLVSDEETRSRILAIAQHYELIAERAVDLLKIRAASRVSTGGSSRRNADARGADPRF